MTDVRLPAGDFYWGVLDTSILPPAGPARRRVQLGHLFEEVLPVHVESVHATYVPTGPDRVVACAMDRQRLRALQGDGTTRLGPDAPPHGLGADSGRFDPESINLMTGPFEPASARRARRRFVALVAAGIALGCTLLFVGFERRVRAAAGERVAVETLIDRVYADVLPVAPARSQPDAARLTAELRTLRRTRVDVSGHAPRADDDVPALLARVLAAWPTELDAQTDALSVSAESIVTSLSVPSAEDAQAVVSALATLEGWRFVESNATPERGRVRVRLGLARSETGGP